MPPIRPSRDGDLLPITAIYAHYVLHGAWRDIVLMEKPLGAGDRTSPE